MTNQYRKKPVVISAVQFNGNNGGEIEKFTQGSLTTMYVVDSNIPVLSIRTLEGNMTVSVEDWVIKGVKGEFYPCKPDIFEATYEEVGDD